MHDDRFPERVPATRHTYKGPSMQARGGSILVLLQLYIPLLPFCWINTSGSPQAEYVMQFSSARPCHSMADAAALARVTG